MQLDRIEIENFKGLREANFEATRFSCIVGENNAGKSSILQAIVYALKQDKIPISQFYDPLRAVVFRLCFSQLTDEHLGRLAAEHREKLQPLVKDCKLTLIVRCKPDEKPELRIFRLIPDKPAYREEAVNEAFRGKSGKTAIKEIIATQFTDFLADMPEGLTTIGAAKDYVFACINELPPGEFSEQEAPLPSGIPSSIAALLPEPIYIPAVRNLADDLKTSQSTSFGRLLGLLLEDMAPDLARIDESLRTLNQLLNRSVRDGQQLDERHSKVKDLEALVEHLLGQNFPQARVELNIPPPELRTILNSAQIYVDDGSRDLIEHKGDGIKRSLTFSLLRAYVQRIREKPTEAETLSAPRPLIFLFEEPELYLHPKSQRVLFDSLATIAETHQVIVTTHSPLFFSPGITAGFTRIIKQAATPKPIGVLHPVNFVLDNASAEVFRLARFENADAAFFSSRVVLFEGESDDAFFKHVSRLLNPEWDFDKKNVAMVRVSGKGNFSKYRAFFESFGIQVKLVADLDALFDGYHHLGSAADAEPLRAAAIQSIDIRVKTASIAAEPSARQIKDRANRQGLRAQYTEAKAAVAQMRQSGQLSEECLCTIEKIFLWEQDIARVRACREDVAARSALVPLLDCLRKQGICVLSKGAIEDYYPSGVPDSGPKPTRALSAAARVKDKTDAEGLSSPLQQHRAPELVEVVAELFEGL